MPAVIFSGNVVKTLKPGINLADNATIYSGNIDPTVSGFDAVKGDVYISTLTGRMYIKQDSGISVNWDEQAVSASSSYTQSFDGTTDWGAPSAGYYTITVLESTHNKGINPLVQIFETDGASNDQVTTDLLSINNSGDVSFRVKQTPDLRFAGKVIIL